MRRAIDRVTRVVFLLVLPFLTALGALVLSGLLVIVEQKYLPAALFAILGVGLLVGWWLMFRQVRASDGH